jgi:DNA mismatch repair protein MutS
VARPKNNPTTPVLHGMEEAAAPKVVETPLMKQYNATKQQYPGTLLLFRVGDFYETFGEDAITASKILNITLTRRSNGAASEVELAGFPHHALDAYLPRLVRAGQRVAVCDQLEDPKLAKGIVKRGVTEIVSPGTALSDALLEGKRNNYLAAVHYPTEHNGPVGMAFCDVSTGEFFCLGGNAERLEKLLYALRPSEVVLPRRDIRTFKARFGEDFYLYRQEDWVFAADFARGELLRHFNVTNLKGFGLEEEAAGATAAGVLLYYLKQNEQHRLGHIARIYALPDENFVALDKTTVRNLELFGSLHPDGKSFVDAIDQTLTPMGARLLRRWVAFPLRDVQAIRARQESIAAFLANADLSTSVQSILQKVGDLERLTARLAVGRINPRELGTLGATLALMEPLRTLLGTQAPTPFAALLAGTPTPQAAQGIIQQALADAPPPNLNAGGVIRGGYNAELDKLRSIKSDADSHLKRLQQTEAQRTGIASLKISYNRVFGYYIEITHANRDKVPADYIRKQTLTGAERYITPELKEFEETMLSAEERLLRMETELYEALLNKLQAHITTLQQNAALAAQIDLLCAFAEVARRRHYCRPELAAEPGIEIEEGRHPVIEMLLPREQPYIPNSITLTPQDHQILLITGPNMAGNSALLRQTALITLLAHMGSYVPAQVARIGVVDKIFTRVGASDNLSAGESTFMVEMNEAARIVNNCTDRSLVLLDEIGRGTATYDGVSIAWALVEHLHNTAGAAALTLFATHYHELAALTETCPRVRNYHVSVQEAGGRILFMRKLAPGSTEHSFGIQVAEMAGMPATLVRRARQILAGLENRNEGKEATAVAAIPQADAAQIGLFGNDAEMKALLAALRSLDVNALTPIEALLKLQELKKMLSA